MEGRQSSLVLLGMGQIARTLVGQIQSQRRFFEHDLGLNLQVVGAADRSGLVVEESGFLSDDLKALIQRKKDGLPLSGRRTGKAVDLVKELDGKLFSLPLHRPILVDLTASESAPVIQKALARGFHVVLANKKPLAVEFSRFEELLRTAREHGVQLRYEATVGAGLPVLDTIAKLREAGDEVDTILGCLSGTLGYLMTQLQDGVTFSAAVREAHSLGYTEPDPRDDLSGMDVARKALILARTLGRNVNLDDVTVGALFPSSVSANDPQVFMKNIEKLDEDYAKQVQSAAKAGKVLRYVARIGKKKITVGLESVLNTSPMAQLRGTDNQIVMHTRRYSTNPLVVTGPGAGAEVTAAGVLNDILAVCASEERRSLRGR